MSQHLTHEQAEIAAGIALEVERIYTDKAEKETDKIRALTFKAMANGAARVALEIREDALWKITRRAEMDADFASRNLEKTP